MDSRFVNESTDQSESASNPRCKGAISNVQRSSLMFGPQIPIPFIFS